MCIRDSTGIERLPSICMPPLPETIAYEQSEKKSGSEIWVNIGIVEEPERQLQKKLELKLSTQNYMSIGSAQSGKTNLLQTIIRGVAENYTPQEVNLYIIAVSYTHLDVYKRQCIYRQSRQ